MLADGTWIFVLEALLVLVLAVLIVWWTLPGKRPPPVRPSDAQAPGSTTRSTIPAAPSAPAEGSRKP